VGKPTGKRMIMIIDSNDAAFSRVSYIHGNWDKRNFKEPYCAVILEDIS